MHKSIVRIYLGDKESDTVIWNRKDGWLIELSSLSHGLEVWAEYDGSARLMGNGHLGRLRMLFHGPSSIPVFPEVFTLAKAQ